MKAIPILIAGFLLLCTGIARPFMPGNFDPVSLPLSLFLQLLGFTGLLTIFPVVLWMFQIRKANFLPPDSHNSLRKLQQRASFFAWSAFAISLPAVAVIAFSASLLLGLLLFSGLLWFLRVVLNRIRKSNIKNLSANCLPLGMGLIPMGLLVFQLAASQPLTTKSRIRAIRNCEALIDEIEKYKQTHGQYPYTLEALYADYPPGVVAIEKYRFARLENSYTLSFEQPRLILNRFGTREVVAFHPEGNHRLMSHASWYLLLPPEEHARTQGWYESAETGFPNWKSFYFD